MASLHPDLLAIIVCPKCKGDLAVEESALRCDSCKLRYRVEDGIPVLLIDEAEPLEGAKPG